MAKHYTLDRIIAEQDRRSEAMANAGGHLIPLRSEFDNTIYGWRCEECGYTRRIHHNPYHDPECSHYIGS